MISTTGGAVLPAAEARYLRRDALKASSADDPRVRVLGNSSTRITRCAACPGPDCSEPSRSRAPNAELRLINSSNCALNDEESSPALSAADGLFHVTISKPIDCASSVTVVVLPLPAGPYRISSFYRRRQLKIPTSILIARLHTRLDRPDRASVSQLRTSETFFLCTANSLRSVGANLSAHGRESGSASGFCC